MTITALSKFAKYAILVLLILNNVKAQWSQASGSSSVNGVGSYGNIGEYRVGNLPPSRAASVWFSYDFNNGQKFFWVFGGATRYTGSSSDQYLNDLWVYNGQYWAWLAGSQSTNAVGNYGTFKSGTYTTTPGARTGSIGWTILENSSPVHYLFGGYGADGLRNDLWRWNGIWTWMNGSSSSNQNGVYNTQGYPGGNSPGSRTESVSWTSPDSRMWLFGGYGYAASGQGVGLLNDLWYFNGVNWIWMDGSQTPNSGGTYGTVGTPSASNQPGGRRSAASAFSSDSCTFYLFGGLGYGLNSQYGMLNDLWSYNCNSGQWTWESGSSGSNPAATYGSQGTASVNYAPAGRQSASLVYKNGYLVLYGGVSYTAYYNDVWVFNTTTKTWAWMTGSPTSTQTTSTTIGSRRNAAAFVDNSTSNLWIYGGYGYNSANLGYLDSTWANSMTILAPMQTTTGTATTATTATTSSTTSATTATTSSTSATTSSTSTTTSSTTSATTSTTSSTSSKGTTSTTSATTGATTSTTSSTSSKGTTSTTSSTTGATTSSTTGSTSTSSSLTSGTSSTSGSTTSDTSSSSSSTNIVTVTTTGGSTTANSSQGGGEGTTGTSSSPTTGDTTTTGGTNTSAGAITTPNSGSIPMNPVIIGSVAGAFVAILLILIVILVVLRRRRNAAAPPTDPERRLPPVPQKSVPIAVLSPVTSSKPSAQEMSPVALRRNSSYAPIRSESMSSTTSFTRFASRNNSIGNGTPLNRPPPPPGRPPSARPGQPPPPIMPRRPSRGSSFSSTSTGYTIETHVDKYSVHYDELHFIKKIGKGSFGKVYLGEWEKMTVAVKICSTMDIAQINEFLEEAKLMMGMRPHPHVIQILGISTNGPHPAMILEYCSGGSLDKLVYSEQTMDPSTIVRIVHGIALGMHHLHRNNIIHRDLACRNILLSETNQPKIADFGLSRFLVVDDGVQTTQSDTLPLRWMAPESLRDRSYSYATDVWSFGILVSEIVNREPPHRTLDIITAAFRIRDEGMTPQLRDDCPSILRDLLQQCWYLDPEYRPSFEEICEVLKASEYVKTSKIPVEIVFTPEETSYM